MGLPKYLESKIKELIKCCTKYLADALVPNATTFPIARPNAETFELDTDGKAIVATNNLVAEDVNYYTGQTYATNKVYESVHSVDLNGANPVTILTGVGEIIEARVFFADSATNITHSLNVPTLPASAPDLSLNLNATNVVVDWSTVHPAGDTAIIFIKHTENAF